MYNLKNKVFTVFKVGDRVSSLGTGRKGQIIGERADSLKVLWDNGEVFYIKPCHLGHEDKSFGMDSNKRPGI